MSTHPRRWLALPLLSVALTLTVAQPCAAARLHVVLACDSAAPDIGQDLRVGASALEGVIRDNMAQAALNLVKVGVAPNSSLDRGAILRAVYALPVEPDDAVMLYYAGHGAYNPNRDAFGRAYGTYAVFTGNDTVLYESEMRAAVATKQPRLSVVILDCCNGLRPIASVPFAPAMAATGPPDAVSPLFQALFFQPSGTYVMESSAPGQYSFVQPRRQFPSGGEYIPGSLFTSGLTSSLRMGQGPMTWDELRRRTQGFVSRTFNELKNSGQLQSLGDIGAIDQDDQTLTVIVSELR